MWFVHKIGLDYEKLSGTIKSLAIQYLVGSYRWDFKISKWQQGIAFNEFNQLYYEQSCLSIFQLLGLGHAMILWLEFTSS